jgi:hypothetical protein
MRRTPLVLIALCWAATIAPAVEPGDILPKGMTYDPAVPTPEKHLGFRVGERHLYHHEVVGYLKALAGKSDRIKLQEYARTYGGRPLLSLTITSTANHKRLEEVRADHLRLSDPKASGAVSLDRLPAVLWMGYGVHGNEPSATNAAPLVAYHLAAGTGADHEKLLDEVVVLLDPSLNPDGFDRFAHWANDHKGAAVNPDPSHREHREGWPTGRTNYYWFDLNRDWVPAQHPESRGRLAVYHQWKPNVVLDFHEMHSNSTFFFQPGAPTRTHPLIPKKNLELTHGLAKRHAAALDKIGSLYFTEEQFDDYYPGKGSTYPDLHGGVGILFEQASSRGHAQDTPNGKLTFPFTIRNQVITSLSSLKGTREMRRELLEFKRDFYAGSAKPAGPAGYVVSDPGNPARLREFLTLLRRHDIRSYPLTDAVTADGKKFVRGESYVIPADQPESVFLRALFENRREFADSIFYDVSAWSLPLAFNLDYSALEKLPEAGQLGPAFESGPAPAYKVEFAADDLAYAIDWRTDAAPRVLAELLAAEVKVRATTTPFRAAVGDGETDFGYGTIVVPLGIQPDKREAVVRVLKGAVGRGVPVHPLKTGLTATGIDLGSAKLAPVEAPKVLLVTGEGVSAYQAGEVWHQLDHRLKVPVTLVDAYRLGTTDLGEYTAIVLVSGTYTNAPAAAERLRQYVTDGGTVVAIGTAINWLDTAKVVPVKLRPREKETPKGDTEFAQAERDAARQLISGAIFRTRVDPTHPLCYGLPAQDTLPVLRSNRVVLEKSDSPYNTPITYGTDALADGYASPENVKLLNGSAGAVVVQAGGGRAILLPDDPNFRAFWPATSRVFLNAVFFGPLTRPAQPRGGE